MLEHQSNNELKYGYNSISKDDGKNRSMLMDFGIYKMKAGEKVELYDRDKEMAIILFEGKIKFLWEGKDLVAERENVFDCGPYTLHVSNDKKVIIEFMKDGEIGVQKTINHNLFDSKLYTPEDCKDNIFGDGVMDGTARRLVRDIFKYENAPYSNMVLGEVITYPGKWSSYPPHSHAQPEIYFYKFTKPQGFGGAFVGENVYKIQNNSALMINGGFTHPQTSAPGYGMYYCWMIRHLDGNPWTKRVDDDAHTWLHDKENKIWPEK
ncbi:5-deoxy-glucuronate isomerase [Fusobacteria bacterium ZRK30]|nr:5-deoxy-glucuronate isomerase [Fusobacteria bacterium ZRK30]